MTEQRAIYQVNPIPWGLANVWNAALEEDTARPVTPRDYLWASELGKSPIDLWLKLRGTTQTNPPNSRAKRKFEAGNLTEWMISLILSRAGLLISTQERCEHQYPGLLKVTGKMDFLAGGRPTLENWQEKSEGLPEVFYKAGEKIVKYILEKYPQGLEEKPLEIKSLSANMFDALDRRGKSLKNHRLQLFHYIKSKDYEKGSIIYICRDDLRMREFDVYNTNQFEKEYIEAIEVISHYHLTGARPNLEKSIVFNEDTGKFTQNHNIAYSGYLTLLYGYKDQKSFDDANKPIVARFNRVLGRLKNGDRLTAKNEEVIKEMEALCFDAMVLSKMFGGDNDEV